MTNEHNHDKEKNVTKEINERVDQIIHKLSATRANALAMVASSRHAEVHQQQLSGMEAWGLIMTSKVAGTKRPTSAWTTALGDAVLARLAGEDDE